MPPRDPCFAHEPLYPVRPGAASRPVVSFTLANHYVKMALRRPPVPRGLVAATLLLVLWLEGASPTAGSARAGSPAPAATSGTRADGVNAPLALAGFAVLSSGLVMLALSRRPAAARQPAVASPAHPAVTPRAVPQHPASPARVPQSAEPLYSVATALHATAEGLDAVATTLETPASAEVLAAAGRIREAQITLQNWLDSHPWRGHLL